MLQFIRQKLLRQKQESQDLNSMEITSEESDNLLNRSDFECFKSGTKFYFRLVAPNGEILMSSEAYETEKGAKTGISSMRNNGVIHENYIQMESKDSKFYYVLKAKNGEIIGTSETFNSKQSMKKSIESSKFATQTESIKKITN